MSENQEAQDKVKEFIEKYKELCEKFGFSLVVNPAFKSMGDGTWGIVLQSSVGKLPEEKSKIETSK